MRKTKLLFLITMAIVLIIAQSSCNTFKGEKGDRGDTGDTGPAGVTFSLSGTTLTITTTK